MVKGRPSVALAAVALALVAELAGATSPVSAQGILDPGKAPKRMLPSAGQMVDPRQPGRGLEDLLADGTRRPEGLGDALVAVLHERLKVAGPHSFGPADTVVLKRALLRAERRVRAISRRFEAGEASPDQALTDLLSAFRDYLEALEATTGSRSGREDSRRLRP